jgi:hypothetical protein
MSLASPQAEAQNTSPLPMPPPGGWDMLEAAGALCPHETWIYRQGGPLSEAAFQNGFHIDEPLAAYPEAWLTSKLVRALCERPDLRLTGRAQSRGSSAEWICVPQEQIAAARQALDSPLDVPWVEIHFEFGRNGAHLVYHAPNERLELLIGARIEAASVSASVSPGSEQRVVGVADRNEQPQLTASSEIGLPIKPVYSPGLCSDWFSIRVRGWPAGEPAPNSDECYAAAQAFFAGVIHRPTFNDIRKVATPEPWSKQGPRRSYRKLSSKKKNFSGG